MSASAYWDTWVTTGVGVIRQMPYMGHARIIVGSRDFIVKGHKTEITRWLLDHGDLPVVCASDHGDTVHLILRGVAPTVMEEVAKAYAGNFAGMSGVGTGVATGASQVAGLAGGGSAGLDAAVGVLTNPSAFSADMIGDKIGDAASGAKKPGKFARLADKVFGKSVVLRMSAAEGTFSNKGAAKGSILTVPSGTPLRVVAGVFARLKW